MGSEGHGVAAMTMAFDWSGICSFFLLARALQLRLFRAPFFIGQGFPGQQ